MTQAMPTAEFDGYLWSFTAYVQSPVLPTTAVEASASWVAGKTGDWT